MGDTMRGLFFIMKGQYRKEGVSYTNTISGEVMYLGGYDPSSPATSEWYQVMDRNTFHTIACGSSLQRCAESLRECIIKYKGDARKYYKYLSQVTSEDYYETHYLNKAPLSPEERVKKAEGRCPRTSPLMKDLYSQVLTLYGDHFSDIVEEAEDTAYRYLKENTSVNKSRKLLNKVRSDLDLKMPLNKKQPPLKKVRKSNDVNVNLLNLNVTTTPALPVNTPCLLITSLS